MDSVFVTPCTPSDFCGVEKETCEREYIEAKSDVHSNGALEFRLEYLKNICGKVTRENDLLYVLSDGQSKKIEEMENTISELKKMKDVKKTKGYRKKVSIASFIRRTRRSLFRKRIVPLENGSKSMPSSPIKSRKSRKSILKINPEMTRRSISLPSSPRKDLMKSMKSSDSLYDDFEEENCHCSNHHDCLVCLRSKIVMKRYLVDIGKGMKKLKSSLNSPEYPLRLLEIKKNTNGIENQVDALKELAKAMDTRIIKLESSFADFLIPFELKTAELDENFEFSAEYRNM